MPETDERRQWLTALERPSDKNWWVAFVLSLVFGASGLDRVYLRSYVLGILKFLTIGAFGIWWAIDLVLLLSNRMHDADGDVVKRPFSVNRTKP